MVAEAIHLDLHVVMEIFLESGVPRSSWMVALWDSVLFVSVSTAFLSASAS